MELKLLTEGRSFTLYSIQGGDTVDEFLGELERADHSEFAKVMRRLECLAQHGSTRRQNEFNTLGNSLFEAKSSGGARVIFFYDKGHIVICACGFRKKSQKTPARVLETARARKDAYFAAKNGGGLKIITEGANEQPRRRPS